MPPESNGQGTWFTLKSPIVLKRMFIVLKKGERKEMAISDISFEGTATKILKPGDILFQEDSPSDEMYFIESGTFTITRQMLDKTIKLGEVGEGEFLGEHAILGEGTTRSVTAEAHTECEVVVIGKDQCKKYFEDLPPFIQKVMEKMAARLKQMNDLAVKLARTQDAIMDLTKQLHHLGYSMQESMKHSGS